MPVRKTTPDKTHINFQWHMFQVHVAPQPLGTVHYLPLLLLIVARPFGATIMAGGAARRRHRPILVHYIDYMPGIYV